MIICWYSPGSAKEVTFIWLSFLSYAFKIIVSFIIQSKTHDISTYVKEIVLQFTICLYEHQSYSKWGTPRKTEKCRATSPLVGIIGSSFSFHHVCSHATIIQDMCKIQGASQDNGNEYITVIYLLGSQEGGPPKVHIRRSTFVDWDVVSLFHSSPFVTVCHPSQETNRSLVVYPISCAKLDGQPMIC